MPGEGAGFFTAHRPGPFTGRRGSGLVELGPVDRPPRGNAWGRTTDRHGLGDIAFFSEEDAVAARYPNPSGGVAKHVRKSVRIVTLKSNAPSPVSPTWNDQNVVR
jgi:hypothetical protein